LDPEKIKLNRLYDDLDYLWPLVSRPKDYAEEAGYWRLVLREVLGPGRHNILEFGVGGGHLLSHLTSDFAATAVDISPKMLAHSMRLNPSVKHLQGDMRTVSVGGKFDAVTIHDAISYMLTEEDLRATFANAAAHLRPGGVFITTPDDYRDSFHEPSVECRTNSLGPTQLTYVEYTYDPDPTDTTVQTIYTYFILERGRLRIELDRHITNLFPKSTWARLIEEAGFAFEERTYHLSEDGIDYVMLVGKI
jgi:SAM-dependent methyltransferase